MSYQIYITLTAEKDLNEAADYIEHVLMNPEAADRLMDMAEEKIGALAEHPERNALIEDPVLRAWGIRFAQVGSYLTFYVVEKQCVYIVRFLYAKRNWIGTLKQGISLE